MKDFRLALGICMYGFASLFLLVCVGAAIHRLRTGRYSSGIHFVPTIAALLGSTMGDFTWKPFLIVMVLDIGTLLIKMNMKPAQPDQQNSNDSESM
jgi:hypothetical protein